jgi:hypothetical protein
MSYSQAAQDVFVLSLFPNYYKGIFVDVGCFYPEDINNTLLLEKKGWTGISVDIHDFSNEWMVRKTPFICHDALTINYRDLFDQYQLPQLIDYLSLDIEGNGARYQALCKVMESGREFKVMTVEHDAHCGYDLTERQPQRKLLKSLGYFLLCSDVMHDGFAYEDWWINPKYFKESEYMFYLSDNVEYTKTINKKR